MIVHHESINHIWKYQCYIMQPWGFYRSWNFNPGVYEPLKLTCKILCICSLLWEGGNQFLPKRCVPPPQNVKNLCYRWNLDTGLPGLCFFTSLSTVSKLASHHFLHLISVGYDWPNFLSWAIHQVVPTSILIIPHILLFPLSIDVSYYWVHCLQIMVG